jgi:hypothetical protein
VNYISLNQAQKPSSADRNHSALLQSTGALARKTRLDSTICSELLHTYKKKTAMSIHIGQTGKKYLAVS